jgi:hypothetical protein
MLAESRPCVFVGPTSVDKRSYPQFDFFPPVQLGYVFSAVKAGYQTICIIDGVFGNVPSVWHKEILFAIDCGATVFGAASMGALRAAELNRYGMIGVGGIFRLYRRGCLTDDDEVCVTHAPLELDYFQLSEPMINFRISFRRLRRSFVITETAEVAITNQLKRLHFSERTLEIAVAALSHWLEPTSVGRAHDLLREYYIDAKSRDAALMLEKALLPIPQIDAERNWRFPRSVHWIHQFEDRIADVPPLPRIK